MPHLILKLTTRGSLRAFPQLGIRDLVDEPPGLLSLTPDRRMQQGFSGPIREAVGFMAAKPAVIDLIA